MDVNSYSKNAALKRFLHAIRLNYYYNTFQTKSPKEFEEWLKAWEKELTEGR